MAATKLAENLAKLRKKSGDSYRELSEKTGITAAYLHALEHASADNPGLKTLFTLSVHYGITVGKLIGERK